MRAITFVFTLALAFTIFGATPANADTGGPAGQGVLQAGQHITIPLKDGRTLTIETTASPVIGRGLARKMGDPSSWIETTVVVSTSFGTTAATYKLHTDYYWDAGTLIQVSPMGTPRVYAPGYGFAYNNVGWFWLAYPSQARSWGQAEVDSWIWTPWGTALFTQCFITLNHNVTGWGQASGTYTRSCAGWGY